MLSVDKTIFIQFLFFAISYFALSRLVFRPYLAAHSERVKLTEGSEQHAERLLQEHKDMQYQYEQKAKQVSVHVRTLFEEARLQESETQEKLVGEARKDAEQLVQKTRAEVAEQIDKVRTNMNDQIPVLASSIASKLIDKDVSQ